jgi:hypothetical protein
VARNDEIARVRAVLYAPARTRKILDFQNNVVVLMNLDATRTLPPGDLRVQAGAGPNWFNASGGVNSAVRDAADYCDKIAALLLDIHQELGRVAFPAKDKSHLRAGLAAQASAWRARARAWRAPGKASVKADTAAIVNHERTSFEELGHVTRYLKAVNG